MPAKEKNEKILAFDKPLAERVIIIHGKDTSPKEKWYPWISNELKCRGFEVIVPALPNANNPTLKEWLSSIESTKPDENTILIGHSRGGVAILRWLERLPAGKKVNKVVLVAANSGKKVDEANSGFFSKEGFDFKKIKSHCDSFVVIHSRDDEWVPFSNGEENAKGLGAKLCVYNDKGHFGKKTPQVPEILQEIIGKVLVFGEPHEGAERRETTSAVIQRKSDGKFMLVKWLKFGWVAPSVGGIDEGESPEVAMEREVLEETGYKVKAIRRLGAPVESHFFAENKNVWRRRIDQPILMELLSDARVPVNEIEKSRQEPIWLTAKEALKQISHPDNAIGLRRFLGLADSLDEKKLRKM